MIVHVYGTTGFMMGFMILSFYVILYKNWYILEVKIYETMIPKVRQTLPFFPRGTCSTENAPINTPITEGSIVSSIYCDCPEVCTCYILRRYTCSKHLQIITYAQINKLTITREEMWTIYIVNVHCVKSISILV